MSLRYKDLMVSDNVLKMPRIISVGEIDEVFNDDGHEQTQFDAVCILAIELLNKIGAEEQSQWQIDEAEKIVRSMLRIVKREAKFFTSDEIKKKLVMASNVISEKFAEYKCALPKIKVVPCNNGSTLQSVDHPEHTDYDTTRCINGNTYV